MNILEITDMDTILSGKSDWFNRELAEILSYHPLDSIETEFPHFARSIESPEGVERPKEQHPVFYGCMTGTPRYTATGRSFVNFDYSITIQQNLKLETVSMPGSPPRIRCSRNVGLSSLIDECRQRVKTIYEDSGLVIGKYLISDRPK